MKIAYCGFSRAGKECLTQLLLAFEDIVPDNFLVFTHDTAENRDFVEFLKGLKIKFTFNSINKELNKLQEFTPDVLLSVYYRYIIKQDILNVFDGKTMNLHPSLLPDYKGCFSSAWAVINGEKSTGISFHYIESGVDTGNIILQKEIKVAEYDTAFSLYHKLISLFVANLPKAFTTLINGSSGKVQSLDAKSRYYSRELPYSGVLNASEISYEQGIQFFKGMYFPPFANAKFIFGEREIEIESLNHLSEYKNFFKAL